MDFDSLVKPEERIKQNLHPLFVLTENNVQYSREGLRFRALSPFREDTNPSLDVFWSEEQGQWRVGDFAEGWQGDSLDLVERFILKTHRNAKHRDILVAALNMLKAQEENGWTGPDPDDFINETFDADAATARLDSAKSLKPLYHFVAHKDSVQELGIASVDPEWIAQYWGVRCDEKTILVPYYKADGTIPAYKWRLPDTSLRSAPGSRLRGTLYGEWQEPNNKPVLLVESESDAWTASYHLPQYQVYALSSGAGTQYKPYSYLKAKHVTLCFDGDDAGRAGMVRWAQSLGDWASSLSIIALPDGKDIGTLRPDQITELPEMAMAFTHTPQAISVKPAGYFRTVGDQQLSDWLFSPDRTLRDSEGRLSYEGQLRPCGRRVVIQQSDMIDARSLIRWASRYGYAWAGNNIDCQNLLMLFRHQSPFLPVGKLTNCIGLTGDNWVMPDKSLGPEYVRYVPPEAGAIDLRSGLYWDEPAPQDHILSILDNLRGMHDHSVTDPILAWLAVAPLRIKFKRFPTLTVTGPSGSGKTTIVETMLRLLSGSLYTTNLTSTTPFAIFSFVKSSTGFPVWFDEYRFGARQDAKQTLDQVLRDAYTGQPSAKGGASQNKMEVTLMQTLAPLVITGEESFTETSHTDRSILVSMPLRGKNQQVYQWLVGENTIAPYYIDWLLIDDENAWPGTIDPGRIEIEGLNDRQKINMATLEFGWKLLNQWRRELGGREWGKPDWGLIITESQEAALGDPITDAMLWGLQQEDTQLAFYNVDRRISNAPVTKAHLRIENLLAEVQRKQLFIVPGGAKAATKALLARYQGARVENINIPGAGELFSTRKVRVVTVPVDSCPPLQALLDESN